MQRSELPVIQCAVCGRPVDKVVAHRDDYDMFVTFRAFCHGQEDVCRIPDSFLVDIGPEGIVQMKTGVAFTAASLPKAMEQINAA